MTVETNSPNAVPTDDEAARIPPAALFLGYAGIVPFLVGTVMVWVLPSPQNVLALVLQMQWAAIILSFVGAVHWGAAIAEFGGGASWPRLGWSIVPAIFGWLAIQLPPVAALLLLIFGFVAAWVVDVWSAREGYLPGWYLRLRKPLTLIVMLCLAGTFFGLGGVLGASA